MTKILDYLYSVADEKYRKFNYKLTPNVEYEKIIGVKIPVLKNIAKTIIKQNWRDFLSAPDDEIFELVMLKGIIIATASMNIEERLKYIDYFLPKINNWNICDIFCTSFKPKACENEIYLKYISDYFFDEREFYVRFAVVLSMKLCTDSGSISNAMQTLVKIKNDGYYAKMAIAWAISVYFIRAEDIVYPYLKELRFNKFVQNKSIQKICESLRVSEEIKTDIRQYKIYTV